MPDEADTPIAKSHESIPNKDVDASLQASQDDDVASTVQPIMTASQLASQKKKPKPLSLGVIVILALLVIAGGVYGYFGVYMQTPENLWKQSLKNTSKGISDYVNTPITPVKGAKLTGSFKINSPLVADGSINGAFDDKSSQLTATAGFSGIRTNLEVRGVTPANASTQDVYLKVDGLNVVSSLLGGSNAEITSLINSIEGKWYVIDHTLLEQAAKSVSTDGQSTPTVKDIQQEVQNVAKDIAVVLNDRLFTTDDSKAVLELKESYEKEDFKGRKSQHVLVAVRKEQFKQLITELKDTLAKNETVKSWLLMGEQAASIEEVLGFETILKQIDGLSDDKLTADVWLDTSLKYIRNVRFTITDSKEPSKSVGSIDFTLDYTGKDEIPLLITSTTTEPQDSKGTIGLGLKLNKKSQEVTLSLQADGVSGGQKIAGSADLKITPSDDTVSVEAPKDAVNILEILSGFTKQIDELRSLTQNQNSPVNVQL